MKRNYAVTIGKVIAERGTDGRTRMTFMEAQSMKGFILSKDPTADVKVVRVRTLLHGDS